jgi:hypothetical protein
VEYRLAGQGGNRRPCGLPEQQSQWWWWQRHHYGLSGNTASINPTSGWGVDQQCLNASSNNGIDCKGTNRSDIALDLLFYPADKMTVKLEYRHDFASNAVFQRNDGSLSRNNDILATQFIYAF